ncbi:serine/arginine repetitive matrix protein 1-like [Physella acuta]|uniref:serine/arginine repetitive matrix protein 1-like n=1 Tax=Physella acuta TaxID=109671 RepID=UPI0027DE3DB8|nr:serine/arginine repetitive matrix protein 1-like [Physella acuta]
MQNSPTISPSWGRSKSDILLLDGLSCSSTSTGSMDLSAPLSFPPQEHQAPVGILLQLKPKPNSEHSTLTPPEPRKPMASPGPAAKKKAGLKPWNFDRSPSQGSRWAGRSRPPAPKQPTPPSFRKRVAPSPKPHETTQKSESVGAHRDSRGSSITSPNNALSSNSMQEVSSLRTQSISTISESRFETCGQSKGVTRGKTRPRVQTQVTSPERWNSRSERQHSVFSNSKSISSFNLSHASPQVIDYQSWLLGNIPVQGRPKSCTYGIRDLRQNTFGASYGLIRTRGHSGGSGFAFGSSDGDSAPIAAVRRRSEKWRRDADSLNVIRGAFLGAAEFLHRRKRNRSRDRDKKLGVDKAVSTASMLTAESQNDDATNAISANELDEKNFVENNPLSTAKPDPVEGLCKNADPTPTEKSLVVDKQLRSIDTQTQIAGVRDSPPIRVEAPKDSPKRSSFKTKIKRVRKIPPRSKSKEPKIVTRTSPERKKRKTRKKNFSTIKANMRSPVNEEKPQSLRKITSPIISPHVKLTRARMTSPSIAESVKAYKKSSPKKGKPNKTNQTEDVSKAKKDGEDDVSGKQNDVTPEKPRVSPGAVISVTYEEDTSSAPPDGASSVESKQPTPKMRLSSIKITNIIIPIQEFASAISETESDQCKPEADDKTFDVHDESSQLDLTVTQPTSHSTGHKKTAPVDNLSEKSTTRRKISNSRKRSKSPVKSPRGKSPNQKTQFFKHRPRSKSTAPAVHKKTHPPATKTTGRHPSPKRRERSGSTKKSALKDSARSPSRGRKQKLNTSQPAAGKTNSAKNTSSSPKTARENYLKIRIQPARLILTKKKIQAWQKQNKMATASSPSDSKTMSTSGQADAQSSSSPEAASECVVRHGSPSLNQPGYPVANDAEKTQTDVDAAHAGDSCVRTERGKIPEAHQSCVDGIEYIEVLETDLDLATEEYRSRRNPSRCGNSRERKLSPVTLTRTSRNHSPTGHLSRKTPMFARYSRMGVGVGGHSPGSSTDPPQKKYVTFRKNWKEKPTEPGASPTPVPPRPAASSSYGIQSSLQKYAKQNRVRPKEVRKAPVYHPPWGRPRINGVKHVTRRPDSSNVGSPSYSIPPRNLAWDSIFDRLDSVDEGKEDNGASRIKYGLLFVVIFIQCLIQYFITND